MLAETLNANFVLLEAKNAAQGRVFKEKQRRGLGEKLFTWHFDANHFHPAPLAPETLLNDLYRYDFITN